MVASDFDGNETTMFGNEDFDSVSVRRISTRTWHLVINNPDEYDVNPKTIKETLQEDFEKGIISYWSCIYEQSLEVNPVTCEKTIHLHVVIYFPNKQRGGWIHKRFPTAALFPCRASVRSLVQYITKDKSGAWHKKNPDKIGEKLPVEKAQFTEQGTIPQKNLYGKKIEPLEVVQGVSEGKTDFEMLSENPALWSKLHI